MPEQNEPRLSDHLSSLRQRGDGFRAPTADYLEGLTDNVLTAGQRPATVRGLGRRWWGTAAAIALLVVSALFLLRPAEESPVAAAAPVNYNSEALLADLDADDINAYISDQLEDFETELYTSASVNE